MGTLSGVLNSHELRKTFTGHQPNPLLFYVYKSTPAFTKNFFRSHVDINLACLFVSSSVLSLQFTYVISFSELVSILSYQSSF